LLIDEFLLLVMKLLSNIFFYLLGDGSVAHIIVYGFLVYTVVYATYESLMF